MLQLGNYLNAQTDDGFDLKRCIRGFSLTSLQIIRNVKGNDKRTTLLDFLVTILEEFNNNAFDVLQELGSIEDATKVQFDVIEQDCKSLEKQFMVFEAFLLLFPYRLLTMNSKLVSKSWLKKAWILMMLAAADQSI